MTGGLELTKYSHDTLQWKFNNDGTVTTSENYDIIEIKVKKNNTEEIAIIPGLSAKDKVTYLGITSSRNGNPQHQLKFATNIAKEGSRILLSNSFKTTKLPSTSIPTSCQNLSILSHLHASTLNNMKISNQIYYQQRSLRWALIGIGLLHCAMDRTNSGDLELESWKQKQLSRRYKDSNP